MSTLARLIVSTLLSLTATVIVDARWEAAGKSASLISAYSIIGGGGVAIMPTPSVAAEAFAPSIIACWRAFIFRCAGSRRSSWFQPATS